MSRARAFSILALACTLGSACGSGEPGVPARVRLAGCPGALLAPEPPAASEVLREGFERPLTGWSVMHDQQDPLAVDPQALRQSNGSEGGRSFLTLAGRGGAVYRVIPVEADTPYLFTGELRARGVTSAKEPFFGATFWLGELSASGTPRELFGEGGWVDRRHPLPSAAGHEGWQERRTAFRTAAGTQSLIVGCVLAVNEELEEGEVDFDALALERVDERELWEFDAARAVAEAHRGDALPAAGDWRARRLIGAMLGAEHRPALLVLPGERLELSVRVPPGEPVLATGLAPWPLAFRPGPEPLVFRVRAGGRELLRESVALDGPLAEIGWRDVECALADLGGRTVTLELSVEGPLPGLFGAPQASARAARASGPNVLLVSIDTLRADHVGAYGAALGATPHLDALAREALVFTDTTASAPYTLPAHATLLSGQFPTVHGVEDRDRVLSPRRSPVLARILAEHGWRTQAFVAGGFLTPDFGFDHGFDGFAIADPLRHPASAYFAEFRRTYPAQSPAGLEGGANGERVRAWLARHAAERFFLFVHTYEVHDYDPPEGTTTCAAQGCRSSARDFRDFFMTPKRREPFPGAGADRAHLVHLYDAALRHVDELVGGLLAELERLGIADETIVVVTSDHGEEHFERGFLQHGKSLYEELLRVPLIVRIPGEPPRRISTPAMQVDVAPTLLAALGLALDPRMQGVDLLGAVPERPVWSEVDDLFARRSSLRLDGWKLLHGPPAPQVAFPSPGEWELYDLASDAPERRDRVDAEPARAERLRELQRAFAEHLRALRAALGPLETGTDLDEETRQLLEHLGY